MVSTIELFAQISDAMAEGTLEAAAAWHPDLVVHSPLHGAGPLVASQQSVPTVHYGLGIGLSQAEVDLHDRRMQETYGRHGIRNDSRRPDAVIDLCPPSMRPEVSLSGWPARYIPYTGGGALPEWLCCPPVKPRVCVTLGSVLPNVAGVGTLRCVIDAVAGLAVDVVLALGKASSSALEPLPANVSSAGWVAMEALLPTCAAVVHHGGAGTTFSALVAGVPQLVLPHAGDQYANAEAVHGRGVGITVDPRRTATAEVQAALIRVLEDPDIRRAADEVRKEIATRPPPGELVPLLAELASGTRHKAMTGERPMMEGVRK
jgi:hypothetical protein